MQNAFAIKGIRNGDGQPEICMPEEDLKKKEVKIRFLAEQKVQMIEWRVDCFEEVDDFHAVSEVLQVIRPVLEHTIFLFTFRTKQQGGSRKMEEWKILKLNELAAKSGCADLIDLEFFEATKPEKEIRRFQRMGVRVIASHHDFDETPDDRILRMLMEQMQQGGADVAKLAVMPKNADDVVRLLKLTNDASGCYHVYGCSWSSQSYGRRNLRILHHFWRCWGDFCTGTDSGWSAGTYSADNPQGTGINKNIKIRGKL